MFGRKTAVVFESLENRMLLHGGIGFGGAHHGQSADTIEFSQAPAVVQTGLDHLASTDGLNAPSSTQTVMLGNSGGVETYSIHISGTGTQSVLTVNQSGNPVTAPTNGTTTFGAVPSAASSEIDAIATALGLTAPASTASVRVSTPSGGTATYSVSLTGSTSSHRGRQVTVDANGVPVGNEVLPFSVMPPAIQNALNTDRPSAATALATTSTQNVSVRTLDGITSYSTTFTTTGTQTTVTVNASGQLTQLPSYSTTEFTDIPAAAQTELQTLATADGVSGTISTTQSVRVYDEANGTTVYSVTLQATKTGATSGNTYTINLTISSDEDGNPTVPPTTGGGSFGGEFGGFSGTGVGGGFFGTRQSRRHSR